MITVTLVPARAERSAATRIVLLAAAYSAPADFLAAGFADAVRARGLDVDLAFAACALEGVADGSAAATVYAEQVAPARAQGCAVWVGGISLGGYVALGCAARHADALAGLCLIAPYLGSRLVTDEIEHAGLGHWHPGPIAAGDDERAIWRFIGTLRGGPLALHLGIGRDDRFAGRHRLLAAQLDPACVDVVPGGHDWATWRALWDRFLDRHLAGATP